ncbi:TIGR01212 family radical SAM protein [Treponema sp. UBA3813]|uniref:TIGR01212 family radical SAM protein n=1 Tax=Treponema sp. UBA3813 TaxID=1947715 RepID=UPI0025EF861D|nr:TIGR01212 family radical SAM protein [Treponema sp. UBA3813]
MLALSQFYESVFSCKTYKLSLDAGCTCPNRDGTKGYGGCIFCSESGSGDFAAERNLSVKEQVEQAKKRVEAKMKGRSGNRRGKYIAYFQNFTSTYGDAEIFAKKYKEALECEDVAGLAIATRPDCLSEEILSKISEISKNHFVQIELGLQTSNEATGRLINRCYSNEDYSDAVRRIRAANPNIHIVTHLIFGLPGESEADMLESVNFVVNTNDYKICENLCESVDKTLCGLQNSVKNFADFFGIKITSLYIVKNTRLAQMYENGEYTPLKKEEYFSLLKKTLPLLPENCVIHRLTGDPPKKTLIAPDWTTDKKRVMNEITFLVSSLSK